MRHPDREVSGLEWKEHGGAGETDADEGSRKQELPLETGVETESRVQRVQINTKELELVVACSRDLLDGRVIVLGHRRTKNNHIIANIPGGLDSLQASHMINCAKT